MGICLGRSAEMVVAMLAILKAGGAYLPLDRVSPAGSTRADARRRRTRVGAQHRRPTRAIAGCDRRAGRGYPETQAIMGRFPEHNPTDCERSRPLRPQHPAYVIRLFRIHRLPQGRSH